MNTTSASDNKKADSCQNCAFTIKDGGRLRCGHDYFQIPALERRTPKLTSFPEVANDHVCTRWSAVDWVQIHCYGGVIGLAPIMKNLQILSN